MGNENGGPERPAVATKEAETTVASNTLPQAPPPVVVPCRSCGTGIYFARTAKGKLCPMNPATRRSHFEDCPGAKAWRGKGR